MAAKQKQAPQKQPAQEIMHDSPAKTPPVPKSQTHQQQLQQAVQALSPPVPFISAPATPTHSAPISRQQTASAAEQQASSLAELTKAILVHLYACNVAYQDRVLSTYYHPQAVYTDPVMTLNGRDAMRSVWHSCVKYLVREIDVDVHFVHTAPYAFPAADTHQPTKRVVVDYTLSVRQLTLLGRVLALVWLLPWTLLLAYAPRDGVPRPGLRVTSTFYWQEQPAAHEKRWIVRQRDEFGVGSMVRSLFALPLMWIRFFQALLVRQLVHAKQQ